MKSIFTILLLSAHLWHAEGQSLETFFDREAQYEHFSGCILIQDANQLVLKKCYGKANDSLQNHPDLAFDVGSVSKQFTAAAILHLAMDGQLELQGSINDYLGPYQSEVWEDVTVHHLLTHTSGIPSLFQAGQGLEKVLPQERAISRRELIGYFQEADLLFDPGDEYQYSNSGYILLATIVEQVSDMTYGAYLLSMFKTYGIEDIQFGPPEQGPFAKPYFNYRSDLVKNAPIHDKSWMVGAGGVYSTLESMNHWIRTINSEDFLTKELRESYFSPHEKNRGSLYYGYGWEVDNDNPVTISHSGLSFGYASYVGFQMTPDAKVIILTNQSFESVTTIGNSENYIKDLASNAWNYFQNEEWKPLPAVIKGSFPTGQYELENGYQINITQKDSIFEIQGNGEFGPTELVYNSPLSLEDHQNANKLLQVADGLQQEKYWSIASACTWDMKLLIYTGVFEWGFGKVSSGLGKIEKAIPFAVNDNYGLIRLLGQEEILDLKIYFDDAGKIQGIFEDSWHDYQSHMVALAFPIEAQMLYIDGFHYCNPSATITQKDGFLVFEQEGRLFQARPVQQN